MSAADIRTLAWFSCGAASAVAAKMAVEKYGDACEIVYCDTLSSEHPDNARFMRDVEDWIGRRVRRIRSERYVSVDDVFEKRKYMSGISGAICTAELKKRPRFAFQKPDDRHIFGLTADEYDRIKRFEENNPELTLEWPLLAAGITKRDCIAEIQRAGIALPVMYQLGYANNNCIGCVKAQGAAYWNKIRKDFPDVFNRRAEQSRALGVKLIRVDGVRMFLDELPPDLMQDIHEDLSCGPQCASSGTTP